MCSGCFVKIKSGGFAHIGAEALGKGGGIIGVNVGVLGRARNGDVGKAGVEEFGERIGVHIDEDAVFGQTLGTVAGKGIAVIEVAHPSGVKIDSSSVIHFHGQAIVIADGFDTARDHGLCTFRSLLLCVNWMRSPVENSHGKLV